MNNLQDKDPFLTQLLKQSTAYEPSADFTQRVMAGILHNEICIVEKTSFFIRNKFWLFAASVFVLLIVTFIFFPSFTGHLQIQPLLNYFNPYINLFKGIANLLKTHAIIPVIIFALAGLLMIDKLLSHLFHPNVQHT